jgi:hypothetical protein
MKCNFCDTELIWQNDFDYDDFDIEGNGIVGIYCCINNDCNVDEIHIYTNDNEIKID